MKQTADELIRAATSIFPQNQTGATVNGEAVAVKDMGEALVHLTIGTFTTGTLDVKVQQSADGSTGWGDVVGAVFSQKGTSDDNVEFVGRIDCEATKNFLRAVGAGASTPNFDYAVVFELIPNKEQPVTQAATSEFSVFETV